MTDLPSDLEEIDSLRAYVSELHKEVAFLEAQLDALVTTFHSHATAQAARISDLERHLQAQLDRRPA